MTPAGSNQAYLVLSLEETAPLVEELFARLEAGRYLPALGTLQALVARISDLSDLCNAELSSKLAPPDPAGPFDLRDGYL